MVHCKSFARTESNPSPPARQIITATGPWLSLRQVKGRQRCMLAEWSVCWPRQGMCTSNIAGVRASAAGKRG
eukprot:6183963-Pleurochrysis_carterae.AAC.1